MIGYLPLLTKAQLGYGAPLITGSKDENS